MRICFLADAGSVNTASWANAFAVDLGHDVHVVSVNRMGSFAEPVTLHHLGSEGGTQDTLGKLGYRVASYGYVGARTGFRPLVVVAQGQYIITPKRSIPKRIFALTAIRKADLLHSWAPHVTERLIELGADPDKILTKHRGIDVAHFSPDESAERVPNSVVVTRNLNRWYRIDTVVRAVALARKEIAGATGTIAGDGEYAEGLKELTAELDMTDHIEFTGRVPHEELPQLLRTRSVYVSAVRTDGVSASLLEAMATGCFPIVRDNAANRHWVEDGVNGLLVAGDEPERFAEAIVAAFRDEGLRERAARLNREIVVERADSTVNMKAIEAAYRGLTDGTTPKERCRR